MSTQKEIWIGLSRQVIYCAKNLGVLNPKIVGSETQMLGYRGPIRVHFCGQWWKLPEISDIRTRIAAMMATGEHVEIVEHK